MELHPIHLEQDGKRLWVVLPHKEYKALCEAYDDALDTVALLEAKIENAGKPHYTLEQVKARIAARKKKNAARRSA
jgi:hypothetical protein